MTTHTVNSIVENFEQAAKLLHRALVELDNNRLDVRLLPPVEFYAEDTNGITDDELGKCDLVLCEFRCTLDCRGDVPKQIAAALMECRQRLSALYDAIVGD